MEDKNKSSQQSDTDKPHDTRLGELFSNKEAFISFLKDCVKADWIGDLDEDSLRRSPKSFVLQDFRKKEADVVYEGTLNNGREKVIFYILQENQRKVDYRMPYRLLLYIVEILRDYYNRSDVKARRRKNFKFPAVFPIVFYNGSGKWTVPQNLKEMFFGHERFGEYLLDFNYALVDVKGYDENNVEDFQSKLLKIMMMFEKSKDFIGVLEAAKKYKEDVISLNDEEKRILGVALEILSKVHKSSQKYNLNEILYEKTAEGVESMLSNVIANAKNYESNLIKKAKKEATEEALQEAEKKALEDKTNRDRKLIEKMIKRGDTISEIADFLEITVEEVERLKAIK